MFFVRRATLDKDALKRLDNHLTTLLRAIPTFKWESGAESVGYKGGTTGGSRRETGAESVGYGDDDRRNWGWSC